MLIVLGEFLSQASSLQLVLQRFSCSCSQESMKMTTMLEEMKSMVWQGTIFSGTADYDGFFEIGDKLQGIQM